MPRDAVRRRAYQQFRGRYCAKGGGRLAPPPPPTTSCGSLPPQPGVPHSRGPLPERAEPPLGQIALRPLHLGAGGANRLPPFCAISASGPPRKRGIRRACQWEVRGGARWRARRRAPGSSTPSPGAAGAPVPSAPSCFGAITVGAFGQRSLGGVLSVAAPLRVES